ncbi:MAG: decaprenyl-phosphate phosphoribosyltransferase [Chloroflexota bacterium]|nr:MAG: decaprenyl-phosphate phosphoribosyltransferase [Chloroflexota bacterium]
MFRALLQTMRPKQWPKNGFLFAGLIFDGQLNNLPALSRTAAGFLLFCLLSSTVYIINDLADVEADRKHPKKRLRPIPSGRLSPVTARTAAILFIILVFPLAFLLSPKFAAFGLVYLVINLAYSGKLKHIPILDVLILASLYVVRVGAGVELIEVARFSPWLYVFTTFLALYLGIGKRRAELNLLTDGSSEQRPVLDGYTLPLLDQLITVVSSMTIITYSLYTFSAENLPANHAMMLTIPFVIYGIFRYLYLVQVEHSGDAPEDVLLSDRPLQITLALFGVAILVIFYALPR